MPKAVWNGVVLAESNRTEVVEGNHYFPADSINKEYFKESSTHTTCPWKGVASYYTIEVDGQTNKDAAWYYPQTKDAAKNIEGYVAFWKGVKIETSKVSIVKSTMPKAVWNGVVLAESDRTEVVEGNHYFPADSINKEYFKESSTHTTCPWKGVASYYTIEVDGQVNKDAAWYYPQTKDGAKNIEGYVAFWRGVKVEA